SRSPVPKRSRRCANGPELGPCPPQLRTPDRHDEPCPHEPSCNADQTPVAVGSRTLRGWDGGLSASRGTAVPARRLCILPPPECRPATWLRAGRASSCLLVSHRRPA